MYVDYPVLGKGVQSYIFIHFDHGVCRASAPTVVSLTARLTAGLHVE